MTNPVISALYDLIDELETNLALMGVEDGEFDSTTGLLGLIEKIKDIPASVGGIDVVTSVSCDIENTTVVRNNQCTLTGVLRADKDDTSQVNVDLEGYLKGATVKIYNGNTLLGSAITNGDGEYSFNFTPTNLGVLSIKAVFEGTEYYESSASNILTITVESSKSLTVSSNKNILSKYDNEYATVTATLLIDDSPVSGEWITFNANAPLNQRTITPNTVNSVSLGSDIIFKSSQSGLCVNFNNRFKINGGINGNIEYLEEGSNSFSIVYFKGDMVSVGVDKVVTYTDTNDVLQTLDLSYLSFNQGVVWREVDVVEYSVRKVTNASGVASLVYNSKSIGDVTIIGEYGQVNDDVTIEDCYYYTPTEYSKTGQGGGDHSSIMGTDLNLTLPPKFEYSFKYKATGTAIRFFLCKNTSVSANPQYGLYVGRIDSGFQVGYRDTGTYEFGVKSSPDSEYHEYKFVRDGSTIDAYGDDNLIGTVSNFNWIDDYYYTFYWAYWYSNTAYVKDIKIKVASFLSVSSDKSVLSYYDDDSATISATLLRGSTPMRGETVTFKKGSTVLGTGITDSNGVATYTYNSEGVGDVTITAEWGQLSEDVIIKDILFARMTEYSCTKTTGDVKQQFFDNNVSLDLPNDFELELEFWSDGSPTWNHQEQRIFIMPKSLYVEGSQPYTAFFIGDTRCGEWEFGVRREGSTSSVTSSGFECEQYQKVKFKRQSDNRIYLYLNDDTAPYDYYQLSDAFNYNDWSICFHLWYNGTVKIRNIKLTEL